MNTNDMIDGELDMSELDNLAESLADEGDFIATVDPTPEAAEVVAETPRASKTGKSKKAKAKAEKPAKEVKAKAEKPAKVAKSKKAEPEASAEGEGEPAVTSIKVGRTAKAKEAKVAKPDRDAAKDVIGADLYAGIIAFIDDDKTAKKVADKAENLLDAIAGRRNLSTYTRYAVDAVLSGGAITSGELVKLLEARDYSPGTARAQAQQMMALLPMTGLVTREKSALTLNEKSPLVAVLKRAA